MIAELIGKYEDTSDEECEHCLEKTRDNIDDFFEFVDCDKDSSISAENIHH